MRQEINERYLGWEMEVQVMMKHKRDDSFVP